MCGIAGAVAWSERAGAGERVARAMAAALRHRGPDGERTLVLRAPLGPGGALVPVCLAHTRLAVIDPSERASQPFASEDGQVLLVFNGEIYNHRALRRTLEQRGHRFRSRCDAEVVLHLYEEQGAELCASLCGMYAFALLDRARGRLLLGRDPLGEKPLFVASGPEGVLFASEPAALLAGAAAGGPAVERRVSAPALVLYRTLGFVPAPHSIFAAVERLLPGEVRLVERGRWSRRRHMPAAGAAAPAAAGGTAARERGGVPAGAGCAGAPAGGRAGRQVAPLRRRLRAALERAVAARLEADVPLGAFLSGGVDSSAVTALARRCLGGPLETFSAGFDEPAWDESRYALLAARALGTRHHVLRLDAGALGALPEVVLHHGEPFADESALAMHRLAAFARRRVTVVLTGDGGDELFAGYRRRRVLRVLRAAEGLVPAAVVRLLGRLGARLARGGAEGAGGRRDGGGPEERGAAAAGAGAPSAAMARGHGGWWRWGRELGRALAALGLSDAERYARWLAIEAGPEGLEAVAALVQAAGGPVGFDLGVYLPDDPLAKTDRATMACGLEARAPLCDPELVALAAALPERVHAPLPWRGKAALLAACGELVPAPIRRRRKMGFGVPVGAWLRRRPWSELAWDALTSRRFVERGLADAGRVRALLEEHMSGRAEHGRRLYMWLAFELFARQLLDPPRPEPVRWG